MSNVNAATVKLPIVWTGNIAAWFVQAEAQFGLRGITTDQTKFWHVVAALDDVTATRAAFVLEDPPDDDTKYEALKKFLIAAFGFSEQQRAQQLLAITDLGDRQPSELMDVMLRFHGKHDRQCYLLREIFLRALPSAVRQGLANSQVKDMRELAAEADRVFAACSQQCLAPLSMQEDLEVNPVTGRRGRRREEPRTSDEELCYFHRRFGAAARQCRPPCAWRQGNDRTGPRQ